MRICLSIDFELRWGSYDVLGSDMSRYARNIEGVEEVVISNEVVDGQARPLYIYSERAEDVGSSA